MEKVDFLFIYEVRNRELENICLLCAELERRGYTTAIVNSWKAIEHEYPDYDAEVLVVSACYNTTTYKFFTKFNPHFKKVINLQWEQILHNGYVESEGTTSWDFWGESLKTRHICWGENTKQRLMKKFGVPEEMLRVTGCISLDFYRPEFSGYIIPKEELFDKYGLDKNKTTMLFISSFSYTSLPRGVKPKSSIDFSDLHAQTVIDGQKAIYDWMKKAAQQYPDIQFIYRAHPAEAEAEFLLKLQKEYPNFFCLSKEPIKHWISACDKIYNWTSTAAAEVYMSGKQSFVLEPLPLDHRVTYRLFENGNSIKTYEGFAESLELPLDVKAQPLDDDLFYECYQQTEYPTYKRICDWFEETYKDKEYQSHHYWHYNSNKERIDEYKKYQKFWTSYTNIALCHISKIKALKHPFFEYRRNKGVFSKKEVRSNAAYAESRTALNFVEKNELRKIIDSFKEIISKQ